MKKKLTALAMVVGCVCLLFAGNLNSKTVAKEEAIQVELTDCSEVFLQTYEITYVIRLLETGDPIVAAGEALVAATTAEWRCKVLGGVGF